MVLEKRKTLEKLFRNICSLLLTNLQKKPLVRANTARWYRRYGFFVCATKYSCIFWLLLRIEAKYISNEIKITFTLLTNTWYFELYEYKSSLFLFSCGTVEKLNYVRNSIMKHVSSSLMLRGINEATNQLIHSCVIFRTCTLQCILAKTVMHPE